MKLMKRLLYAAAMLAFVFAIMSPQSAKAAVKKFNVKTKDIQAQQLKYSVTVVVDGGAQTFAPKKEDVVKYSAKWNKKNKNKNKKTMTVKTGIVLNRSVANVKLEGTATYKFKNNKWKMTSFEYDKSKTKIISVNLKGNWEGTYTANSGIGLMKCSVNIPDVTIDGFISADSLFSFSPTPTSDASAKSGSYYITGGCDLSSGKISFKGNDWKEQPDGWNMIDFTGKIDLLNKKIAGYNYSLSLEKTD